MSAQALDSCSKVAGGSEAADEGNKEPEAGKGTAEGGEELAKVIAGGGKLAEDAAVGGELTEDSAGGVAGADVRAGGEADVHEGGEAAGEVSAGGELCAEDTAGGVAGADVRAGGVADEGPRVAGETEAGGQQVRFTRVWSASRASRAAISRVLTCSSISMTLECSASSKEFHSLNMVSETRFTVSGSSQFRNLMWCCMRRS